MDRTAHIILYAKYHYKRSDNVISDLQEIIYRCGGIKFHKGDLIRILVNIVTPYVDVNQLFDVIYDISPDGCWKWNDNFGWNENAKPHQYDFWNSVARKCLSILSLLELTEIKGNINIEKATKEIFDLKEKLNGKFFIFIMEN